MAIIVDKEKKRADIACSCKELLLKSGFNSITISKITKTAGISKGSFYDYFENKEDLVFEILSHLMQDYNKKLKERIDNQNCTINKIKELKSFFYKDEYKELRSIYKQFAAISLIERDEHIAKFQRKNHQFYKDWLDTLIQEGISKGELKQEASLITEGLFAAIKGFYISFTVMNKESDLEKEIGIYLDNLFKLLKVNK